LRRGLAFIASARTISTQFEFVVRAWMRNADFPEPNYFVPAVRREPWTWVLPD
jgi:hypothetical protein